MYRYYKMCCAFKSEQGGLYAISLKTPLAYETEKEAEKDTTTYRFRKEGGKVKLIAYPSEWFKTEQGSSGRKVVRSVPVGDPIARYTYRQFIEAGGILKKAADEEDIAAGLALRGGFIRSAEPFDDLFPSLEAGAEIYIGREEAHEIMHEKEK